MSEGPRTRLAPGRIAIIAALSRALGPRQQVEPSEAVLLVEQASSGDADAQAALRERIEPVIRARARAFVARRVARRIGIHDAEDLLQQVWLALWADGARLLRAYDPKRGMGLEGYVGMITQRELWHAAEQLQTQKRSSEAALSKSSASSSVDSPSPECIVATRQVLAGVDAFVRSQLSARAQHAYVLLYADGKSVAEVARTLGTDEQTVYNFQHEVRKHARSFMARYEDGDPSPP